MTKAQIIIDNYNKLISKSNFNNDEYKKNNENKDSSKTSEYLNENEKECCDIKLNDFSDTNSIDNIIKNSLQTYNKMYKEKKYIVILFYLSWHPCSIKFKEIWIKLLDYFHNYDVEMISINCDGYKVLKRIMNFDIQEIPSIVIINKQNINTKIITELEFNKIIKKIKDFIR